MHSISHVALALSLIAFPIHARAQTPCYQYDASLGTRPTDQGWSEGVLGTWTCTLEDGVLRMCTLPFTGGACADPTHQNFLYWQMTNPGIDFADTAVFEVRVRIVASQDGTGGCGNIPRGGFSFVIVDTDGDYYRVGITERRVYLTNSVSATPDDAGFAEVSMPTSVFRTYRLDIRGSDASLFVDGVERLNVGTSQVPNGNPDRAWIGDGTQWANAEADILWFRLSGPGCHCVADITGPPPGLPDGNVDALDFLRLISQWGSPCGGPCDADITGPAAVPDGNVDSLDFLTLIAQWGSPANCVLP